MSANIWRGDAVAVQQVTTFTVAGTPGSGDTISVTTNRKTVTYTLNGSDTADTAAAALCALASAAQIPEFQEVTWAYDGTSAFFTVTASNAGTPFVMTAGASGTTTLTAATPVASTGPNQYDDANNWSLGTVPTTSDQTIIDGGSDLLYGAGTVAGASVEIRASFAGNMGLPERNALGYYEYRNRYITLDAATVKVGEGAGAGSSRLLVKAIASSTWTVYATSQRESAGLPACDIDATGNPTLLNVSGGDVGICAWNEATARTFANVGLSAAQARLTVGRAVTVTALDLDNGQVDIWGTITAAVMGLGTINQYDGTLTAITSYGGRVNLMQSGAVTSAVFRGQGKDSAPPVCDCTGNNLARTFTNSEFTGGAGLLDPNKSVTFTNPYLTDGASYLNSDIGPRFSIQRS